MAIWYILWQFGVLYGHLAYFMAIWHILWQFRMLQWQFGLFYVWPLSIFLAIIISSSIFLSCFVMFYQEKSGNPGEISD
jgi:hypothetical protein